MRWSLALAFVAASLGPSPQTEEASGVVTLNGQPLPNQVLQLSPADLKSPRLIVRTDAAGRFTARVDREAVHHVLGGIDGRSLPPMDVVLRPGRTDANVAYAAGILRLRLPAEAQSDPLTIVVRMANGTTETRTQRQGEWRLVPLPFGEYIVSALTNNGLVSDAIKIVRLSPEQPDASVDFTLVSSRFEVILASPDGAPVPAVSMTASFGLRLRVTMTPLSPGRYAVAGMPPGTELQIQPAAPYAPACRLAPINGQLFVDISRGRSAYVVFERLGVYGPSGTIAGAEGSDCPVPFTLYRYTKLPGYRQGFSWGRVDNFPTAPDLLMSVNGLPLNVLTDADGVVRIR